ncbi:MAG: hypothetical protein RIT43_1796, partial [Bacteroidota bacterium]
MMCNTIPVYLDICFGVRPKE